MSKQVVRVASYGKGSLGAIGNEAERKAGVNHRNKDIDPERTHLDVFFKRTEHGFYTEWQNICKNLNVQFRETKTATAFEGMIVTAESKFFQEKFGWEKDKPMPPEMEKFFQDSYQWAVKEIGYRGTDKNIISAVVHCDETSAHLQMYYVPVTERWQEKVYAKDESGKVLRTEKGTPIQQRDEKGKIVYRIKEDLDAPKLSRTEFWRVRGGQTSYSQMQDRFHNEIGQRYDLERGEVGSNKKHQTKHEWETKQMKSEIAEIREQIEDLQGDLDFGREEVATNQVLASAYRDEADRAERDRDSAILDKDAARKEEETARQRAEELKKQQVEAEKKAAEAAQRVTEAAQTVQQMQAERNALRGDIDGLKAEKDKILTSEEVGRITWERTVFGGVKGITDKELNDLKKTAAMVDTMRDERDHALSIAAEKEQWAIGVVDSANAQLTAKVNEANTQLEALREQDKAALAAAKKEAYLEYSQKTSSMSWELQRLRRENQILTGKVNRLEQAVDYLKGIIREKLPEMVKSVESRVQQLVSRAQGRGYGE